jgi:CheY-like chemotaxis protein
VTEKPTVLVVDDDELMRWLMEEALGGSFRVVLAESGEDALALARTACPKAVVLDVDLPGISGFETCRQLKASDATAQVPVVFVSGSESAEDRSQALAAGGEDLLVKPVPPEILQAKLAQMMKR